MAAKPRDSVTRAPRPPKANVPAMRAPVAYPIPPITEMTTTWIEAKLVKGR